MKRKDLAREQTYEKPAQKKQSVNLYVDYRSVGVGCSWGLFNLPIMQSNFMLKVIRSCRATSAKGSLLSRGGAAGSCPHGCQFYFGACLCGLQSSNTAVQNRQVSLTVSPASWQHSVRQSEVS